MRICFLGRPIYDKVSTAVFNCLKKNFDPNVEGIFITTNKKESGFIKERIPEAIVYETASYIKQHWNKYSEETMIAYERKYNCSPVWSYIYTDRFLINRDYDYTVKMTSGLFDFFEYIFSNNDVDYYYSETIATLLCYVAYIVGRHYGVKYVAQMGARGLDATHHYVLNDPFQGNVRMEKDYLNQEYSKQEWDNAEAFLNDFEQRDIRPSYMTKNGAVPKLKISYLSLPLKRTVKRFCKEYNDPYSYINYKSYKDTTNPIKFYFRYQDAKKYYHPANYSLKYVYFPLHYQPEASTIVCAAKYEKQLFFIDSWAKSLPADTVLYVKEHYAVLGHRDLQFYKELKKYPNVVLIDPYESSRKLIENAFAVTTLTGTAGWEAMLLRKPVFICGNIFFDNAPGIIKCDDIYLNYLEKIDNWEQPKRDDTIRYLCAYFRSLRKGSIIRIWQTDDEENVYDIAKSLYDFILDQAILTKVR